MPVSDCPAGSLQLSRLPGSNGGAGTRGLSRAAVEGVLCGWADALDALVKQGARIDQVLLIGGGARSEAVRRAPRRYWAGATLRLDLRQLRDVNPSPSERTCIRPERRSPFRTSKVPFFWVAVDLRDPQFPKQDRHFRLSTAGVALTSNGTRLVSFRLASTERRFDPSLKGWRDGDTVLPCRGRPVVRRCLRLADRGLQPVQGQRRKPASNELPMATTAYLLSRVLVMRRWRREELNRVGARD